jgi:hypothetical protein
MQRAGASIHSTGKERIMQPSAHVKVTYDKHGAVVMDLRTSKYFSLNGVAADIWVGIMDGLSLERIIATLGDKYDVPAERLENDVRNFVAAAIAKGLVNAA